MYGYAAHTGDLHQQYNFFLPLETSAMDSQVAIRFVPISGPNSKDKIMLGL
jgi:hypothetical protein